MKMIGLILALLALPCAAQAPKVAGPDAPSKVVIAPAGEPGEPIIVTGVVTGRGGAPLRGASVYVYHTDVRGHYQTGASRGGSDDPRLRGYLRTDAAGRYEYRTIKPGPYPDARIPAHIHYVVSAPGHRERVFEIVFEGDPFVDDRIRADAARAESAFSICRPTKDSAGVWRCTQDIRLAQQ